MAMSPDILADLLQRWAYWVAAGNRAGLGYAMAGYKERIGTSWSTDSTPPPVDPDVLRLDDAIKRLPDDHRIVVIWHYTQPGTAKAKQARLDMSRDRYYELLDHARLFVAHLMEGETA